ncbi:ABC transporter ATP-binding protein [Roseburia sp. AF22-2LB]|uniref:ABC transporter ATP-binding protein n=1 Tax=unclassified Roseburia TaxID=2637578 RepID=UPI000E4E3B4C|nr:MULTISPECIES: ABC transporter ATP-binding protein [unclassified Roseburia]RGG41652.1 ABC transporter ATP-binding protein [Roseburia sp. AF22-8AC]RGG44907.1 ABC transporter ATP-binding protein [Roseburia sp. AF22-2LB]
MRKLLRFLKDYKKESILSPLFKLLEASFELFVPLVMAAIIDTGIGNKDGGFILKMCGILILLALVGLTCSITAQYFAAKAAVGFATKVRHALFDHIQKLSYTEMDTAGTDTMITRMTSDINQAQSGVNMVLRLFLRSPFIVFGAMIMAFTIDVKAALIFVVTIPVLSVVVFGIMIITIPLFRRVQASLDKVLGVTRENLTGSRVIRAFNKEQGEIADFDESNERLTDVQLFVGKISALMNPLTYIIINVALVILIWTGAIQVNIGKISQGEVVALVNYMSQILVELVKLANLIITVTKAIACGNRVQSIFEMETSMVDGNGSKKEDTGYTVEFRNVSMRYKGAGADTLTGIDFKAKPGDTIGIIGGTGSGKSSVVNLIPRFYDVTEGQVMVDGMDVREYKITDLRDKIGIVPQKAVLFAGTVRSNLAWGKEDATEEEMQQALSVAQAAEVVDKKDGKLDAEVEQGGKNFSGGQKQRLTIARALVKQPEILIMDDSSSALDYATDAKLRQAIHNMPNRPTVFIVSQRAASIMYADKIIVLDDGTVAGTGTHEELLKDCSVYQEIYYSQFKRTEGGH